jgi:hypothetical protein
MAHSIQRWYLKLKIRWRQFRIAELNQVIDGASRRSFDSTSNYLHIRRRIDDLAIANLLDTEKLHSLGD